MDSTSESGVARGGVVETRRETERSGREIVEFWREQIRLSTKEEKDWTEDAQAAVKRYSDREGNTRKRRFNILYANIETIVPAIYNSLPQADVRRRFGDPDAVGRVASQALQRALDYCLDAYPFHEELLATVYDSALPGRGVARVRYQPTMQGEEVTSVEVTTEHVFWEDYRQHLARDWRDVRWVAYRHLWTREQLVQMAPEIGKRVPLGAALDTSKSADEAKNLPDVYKRAVGWEIWDRERREVVFVADDWPDEPIQVVEDPYGLKSFFPQPRPLLDVVDVTGTRPICPYTLYKDQAEELDRVTQRIMALVNVIKWRGFTTGTLPVADLESMQDGELKPLHENPDMLAMLSAGNLDNAIWLWPIDKAVQVLRELIAYRESVKATIYEITGISDILRGATNPNETATAQGLKAQWGSQRMVRRQAEVQRFARDLIRLKAELIGERMPAQQMAALTGIQLPTPQDKQQAQMALASLQQAQQQAQQAGHQPPPEAVQQAQQAAQQAQQVLQQPTWEDVAKLLSSDEMRGYRVDIETDSTVRADMSRFQTALSGWVEGMGSLTQAMGAVVQVKPDMVPVFLETMKAGARTFKLGKQLEDAIEEVGPEVQMPPEKGGKEADPQAEMAKAIAVEKLKGETAIKVEQMRAETQIRMKQMELEAEVQIAQQKAQIDAQVAQQEMAQQAQMAEQEMGLEREKVGAELTMQREQSAAEMQISQQDAEANRELQREQSAADMHMREREHKDSVATDRAKIAAAAKAKPKK